MYITDNNRICMKFYSISYICEEFDDITSSRRTQQGPDRKLGSGPLPSHCFIKQTFQKRPCKCGAHNRDSTESFFSLPCQHITEGSASRGESTGHFHDYSILGPSTKTASKGENKDKWVGTCPLGTGLSLSCSLPIAQGILGS